MELKDLVTNKELSEKIKNLGVKQESLFWYNNQGMGHWHIGNFRNDMSEYSAFTCAELGEMLPCHFCNHGILVILKHTKDYTLTYEYGNEHGEVVPVQIDGKALDIKDKSLANAMAKMLIYLIENNLLEI